MKKSHFYLPMTFLIIILASCEKLEEESDEIFNCSVYPNPFLENFNIRLESGKRSKISIVIKRSNEEIIYENHETILDGGNHTIQIDALSTEPQGIYLLYINYLDRYEVFKLIKG
ncbi:MAG: T9SS type A sorting domain-containing protein [Bacteroidales bacterium]|nr:T9SS type A sorting domain-containing protein [Bacteroidales bacterium]